VNNPFRAAQNPQATVPQHDPALADAVAVAVVDDASLSLRVPVKMRPLLKRKIPTRPHPRQLKPLPPLRQPLRPNCRRPSHLNNPRALNAPNVPANAHHVLIVPHPNHSRRAARPSQFAHSLSAFNALPNVSRASSRSIACQPFIKQLMK
jgi:hypothetical protein